MSVDITALGPLVKKNLSPLLVSALNREGPMNELGIRQRSFLGILGSRGQVEFMAGGEYAGELIVESVSSNTAKFVDSDDVMGAPESGENDEIKIPWKQARDVVKMKRIEKAKSKGGQLYGDWDSLWAQQVAMKLKSLVKLMETHCLLSTGTGGTYGKSLFGIPWWIADTGVLGAGSFQVDRAVETWAKSIIVDAASGSKVTIALLRQLRDAMETQRGMTPDVYLMNRNQLTNYQVELEGASRARVQYTTLTVGDSEFEALFFDGIPMIAIPGYSQSRIDAINWDLWKFKVLLDEDDEETPHVVEGLEHAGFPFNIHALPVSTSHYAAEIEIFPQLFCQEPWNQGALINLQT